jgi:hypothetical protein
VNGEESTMGEDFMPKPHDRNVLDCNVPNPFPVSSFASSLHPVILCDILQAFNNMGRDENNDQSTPLDWASLCDDFDPVDSYLCPNLDQLSEICAHPKPYLNPAVKENYCEPMFASISDSTAQTMCTRMCINYVSKSRGNCCDLEC